MTHDNRDVAEGEDKVDLLIKGALSEQIPSEVEGRMRRELAVFHDRLRIRELAARTPRPIRPLFRLLVRAGVAAATVATILYVAGYLSGGSVQPSWAEVVEQFGSVPYFNATIYARGNSLTEPVQLDLWMGDGGRLRLRAGNEVFFGEHGRITHGVPFSPTPGPNGNVEQVRRMVEGLVAAMGDAETLSLETLIRALPGNTRLSSPLANDIPTVSRDLTVFDAVREESPDWTRIWALRESRLPVRLMFWNPGNGESVDVFLSYADRQPAAFFDPVAFERALAESASTGSCGAYCLQQDPAGRPITQRETRKQTPPVQHDVNPI
ncbi:MAG: hypothetical protein IT366_00690 [Candidatus Hydrogenedentes bacterium]|nr:hypothetical protein [Candidatus Hydrogenedentota bacterium]